MTLIECYGIMNTCVGDYTRHVRRSGGKKLTIGCQDSSDTLGCLWIDDLIYKVLKLPCRKQPTLSQTARTVRLHTRLPWKKAEVTQ